LKFIYGGVQVSSFVPFGSVMLSEERSSQKAKIVRSRSIPTHGTGVSALPVDIETELRAPPR